MNTCMGRCGKTMSVAGMCSECCEGARILAELEEMG